MPGDIDFAGLIDAVARRLFGEPNERLSTKDQLRFGSRGSLAVKVAGDNRGTWYDHEAGEGGGLLDLLERKKGLVNGQALAWLRDHFGCDAPARPAPSHTSSRHPGRIVATYDYQTADGELVFQVVRYEPKDFRQRRPDGRGGWIWNTRGLAAVPYRLPALLAHRAGPVFVVEGEKDVHALERIGLVATCNPGGAVKASRSRTPTRPKWPQSFAAFFAGKNVVVLPDNDEAGRTHAEAVAANLRGTAAHVRILALPGLAPKGDVADWIEAGGDRGGLLALADGAPELASAAATERDGAAGGAEPPDDRGPAALSIGSDAEIARFVARDLERRHGPVVFSEGAFWRYAGTHWEALPSEALWLAACRYDGARASAGPPVRLSKSRVESILALMRPALTRTDFFDERAVGINCMSGFIRFSGGGVPTLVPHSPEHRQRHVLAGRWPTAATDEERTRSLLATLLEGCFKGDEDKADKIDLLGEVAGVAALGAATRLVEPKALVLKGESAENGKSEVLNALRALLPVEAVASISPARFADRTFACHLAGKLLNAPDELSGPDAIASDAFKQIITGEPLTVRDVYKSAFVFRPAAQHVFATNTLPGFQGGMDRGVRRRLLVLTFKRVIPRPERIERIGLRIGREEPDLLLDWAVRGASRALATRGFKEPRSSAEALRDWMCSSDPVLAWLESDEVAFSEGAFVPETRTGDAHSRFKRWALEEGYDERKVPSINGFSQRVVAAGKGIGKRRDSQGPLFIGLACTGAAAGPLPGRRCW